MGAVGGAGPCGGGGEGVLVVCGTMALVGTVVRVGGGGGCACGTRDGVVRCSAPRGTVAFWGPLRWGVLVMQLVGVPVVLGPRGVGIQGGGGVVMGLRAPCPLALPEPVPYGVDVCWRWSLAGLPG